MPVGCRRKSPRSAPRPPPDDLRDCYLQEQYATLKRNLTGAAEKMPPEHFSFRPTPEVRTYAELFAHTVDTQYFYCNTVKGGPSPIAGKNLEKSATDKAAVVQMVKDWICLLRRCVREPDR